jgi:hypothetical protein
MTIQRQYSLPNCTLTLEGFADGSNSNPFELRPVMSILTSAECRLMQQVLRGGKDFLDELMTTVSHYAQEVLSGIHVPRENPTNIVSLKRLGPDQHELSFTPENATAQTATLNTVQLFDLVEAIDQFIADTQTLPTWSPGLRPASKRFAPREPMSKQAVPLATGIGSLILAAAAFAAIPTPQIKPPSDLTYGAATTTTTAAASPSASPAASASPNPSPNASPAASPSAATSDPGKANPSAEGLPEITDPQAIGQLGNELEKQLQTGLKPDAKITQPVSYRVSVGKDGRILGYRPESPTATDFVNQTPLPKLAFIPAPGSPPETEPLGSFRATFQPDGKITVTPWNAPTPIASASPTATPSPSPTATPSSSASPTAGPIVDVVQLKALQPKLYDTIDAQWKTARFKENVTYLVRVDGEGKIIDYSPNDQPATDALAETPLPALGKPIAGDAKPSGSYASFKVVFTPEGRLQINPWDGYPGQ